MKAVSYQLRLAEKQYTFDAAPLDVADVDFWESGPSKALKQSEPWCVVAVLSWHGGHIGVILLIS